MHYQFYVPPGENCGLDPTGGLMMCCGRTTMETLEESKQTRREKFVARKTSQAMRKEKNLSLGKRYDFVMTEYLSALH